MPLLLLALSCAADDPCDVLCDVSLQAFSSCLDENGQEWGAQVGYVDADDYLDWCGTYVWELRQLGQVDTCDTRLDALSAGGCDGHTAAWTLR